MPTAKEIEDYRAELAMRFEREIQEIVTELAGLEAKHHELDAILKRLRTEIPHPDACPACYYLQGVTSLIRSVAADPSTPRIDRFKCENDHEF